MERAKYSIFTTPVQTVSRNYAATDIKVEDLTCKEISATLLTEKEKILENNETENL